MQNVHNCNNNVTKISKFDKIWLNVRVNSTFD